MGRPILVQRRGRHRQLRHRARKEWEGQIPRKSCLYVALGLGDCRSSGGCLCGVEDWIKVLQTDVLPLAKARQQEEVYILLSTRVLLDNAQPQSHQPQARI